MKIKNIWELQRILRCDSIVEILGSNYYTGLNEEKVRKRNIKSLENLGFQVILQ